MSSQPHSADLDLCGDNKTAWTHSGFGESSISLLTQVMGKPGVTKGGQIVPVSDDACWNRPRTCLHHHKCHQAIPGFAQQGRMEVRMVMDDLKCLVQEEESDGRRQVLTEKPHSAWDNFFSGDKINNWIGLDGFGTTMTCLRHRLPKGLPDCFFHMIVTAPGAAKARGTCFNNPMTDLKHFSVSASDVEGEKERKQWKEEEKMHQSSTPKCMSHSSLPRLATQPL
jgi:hypothetical protein